MMVDESLLDDDDPAYRQTDRGGRDNDMNDTYANFDDSVSDEEASEKEDYNSEEEKSPRRGRAAGKK